MSLVKNINYQVGSFSLNIPELVLPDQGLTLLSGESGCGKSTLIDLLVGFRQSTGMSWDFKGIDLCQLSIAEKQIGLVLQGGLVFPHLSFQDCVRFAAESRKKIKDIWLHELTEFMVELSLPKNLLSQKTAKLSGGERQRLALICALIGSPKLLLLDEPFSALDKGNKMAAVSLISRFIEQKKIPALVITHDQSAGLCPTLHIQLQSGNITRKKKNKS